MAIGSAALAFLAFALVIPVVNGLIALVWRERFPVLIFLAAIGTYAVSPALAPDVAPAGLAPAARAEVNRIESIDPYVGEFLLGALLAAALIAGAPKRRAMSDK